MSERSIRGTESSEFGRRDFKSGECCRTFSQMLATDGGLRSLLL
jgi:hypothetical protein